MSFDDHHKEVIRRRADKESRTGGVSKASTFSRNEAASTHTVFEIEDQNVVLISVSHRGVPPLSLDGKGAVRLYGGFTDDQDALDHAKIVAIEDGTLSLMKYPMREWFVVPSTLERMAKSSAMSEKMDEILAKRDAMHAADERDFEERYAKREEVRDESRIDNDRRIEDLSDASEGEEVDEPEKVSMDGKKTCRRRLSAATQVAGQRYAVASFLYPTDDVDGEFLAKIYACFDTTDEADAWVRNVAAPLIQKDHLDVVKLHDWIRPAVMASSNAPGEVFRDMELDAIMQHRRSEPRRVQEYKDWLEANPERRTLDDSNAVIVPAASTTEASSS